MKTPTFIVVSLVLGWLVCAGAAHAQQNNDDPEQLTGDYHWTFDAPARLNGTDRRVVYIDQNGECILKQRIKGNEIDFSLAGVTASDGPVTITVVRRYVKGGTATYREVFGGSVGDLRDRNQHIHLRQIRCIGGCNPI